jgi:hypothetical protein
MYKSNYKIPPIFFLSICMLGCNSECNQKSPPYSGYSRSISESRNKGVFQYEVSADKSIWMLDTGFSISIEKAWVENSWSGQVLVFGKTPIRKDDSSYQIILKLIIDSSHKQSKSNYFYFVGSSHLDTFIYHRCQNYYSNRIDTIKVPLYRELLDYIPSKKNREAFDTITFTKKSHN